MLTQCALEDDLLAEAITQSALIINQDKTARIYADQFVNRSIEIEVSYFSLNENSSLENSIIQNQ
jgi:hypothetical protein